MSNIVQFCPKQQPAVASDMAMMPLPIAPDQVKPAVLRARAREVFALLACQLEFAMQHARAVETQIRDPGKRQEFSDRIQVTRGLLDMAHRKIQQL